MNRQFSRSEIVTVIIGSCALLAGIAWGALVFHRQDIDNANRQLRANMVQMGEQPSTGSGATTLTWQPMAVEGDGRATWSVEPAPDGLWKVCVTQGDGMGCGSPTTLDHAEWWARTEGGTKVRK